jgi:hypothetical protein
MMAYINGTQWTTATFVTLTWRWNQRNDEEAYKTLRRWHRRMCKVFGRRACVWRKELQKRGAIHYHLFALDAENWTYEGMRDEWLIATQQEGDTAARAYGVHCKQVDILTQKDAGVIVAYMCKYASKDADNTKGRAWGILAKNEKTIPKTTYEAKGQSYESALHWLERAGGKTFPVTGGGYTCRIYLGVMGRGLESEGLRELAIGLGEAGFLEVNDL